MSGTTVSLAVAQQLLLRAQAAGEQSVVFDEASKFITQVGPDPRDAAIERCHRDEAYLRRVGACLQVRISIQADQTFRHPPDRRAEITRIMVAAHQRRAQILENQPV